MSGRRYSSNGDDIVNGVPRVHRDELRSLEMTILPSPTLFSRACDQ